MSVGKRFEYQLRNAFREAYPNAYVEKNTDRMYGSGASVQSPPDLVVNSSTGNYLIECKAVKGKSLAFNRLSDDQHRYLTEYDRISDDHRGYVAALFYNGSLGKARVYRAWLIPIRYWVDYELRYPRKSIAMKHIENDLKQYELVWNKGSWILPDNI